MPYEIRSAARSHVGKVREINEDSYLAGQSLLVVADGMGGHAAGEVASEITTDTFARIDAGAHVFALTERLQKAVDDASSQIAERVEADPDLEGMGTTVTAILFGEKRIVVANVGDSRAYLYQRDRHSLSQITHDDSFVQVLVESGEITAEEAVHHPFRNIVLKSINGDEVAARFTTLTRVYGDRYLLCSDGLTDYVEIDAIREALDLGDLEEAADRLIELTLAEGAPDNVTVVLAEIVRVGASSDDHDEAPADSGGPPTTKAIPAQPQ